MDSPFLLVDLDLERPPAESGPRVIVGVAAQPRATGEGCDVLLTGAADPPRPWVGCADPQATARRLAEIVTGQPAASVALVQVLRMGGRLSPADRLVAESLAYSTLQGGAGFRDWLAAARPRTPRPADSP